MTRDTGLYIENRIAADIDLVWRLTQQPTSHQRWDLRFTEIKYLPRINADEPQQFLYQTKIGFGLRVCGTGETIGQHDSIGGGRTSSLRFSSADWKSLITTGSGYWQYEPTATGLRFITWYDYEVRFGSFGRLLDRLLFRPLMGWATAWSFDRLRLWAEDGIPPESSFQMAAAHTLCRVSLACVWVWHGLVPKLLFRNVDEQIMLARAGIAVNWLPWIGTAEILLGLLVLATWRWRGMFLLQISLMLLALGAVAIQSPAYLTHAFNPVTLNLLVVSLAAVGWIVSSNLPSARRCLRVAPQAAKEGSIAL